MVKLHFVSPLYLISNAIRYSHGTWDKSDTKTKHIGEKDFSLIQKVGFHDNHSSVLEHSMITFDVELSTKGLLEYSRHRIGTGTTVTSTRYALNKIPIKTEKIGNEYLDNLVDQYVKNIQNAIDTKKGTMDELAMTLPQNYMYKMQLTFNIRSLSHFLRLRLHKSAHITIRSMALEMFEELPKEYQELLLCDKKILEYYLIQKEI